MNDVAVQQEDKPKRRGRGKGTKPTMAHINIRIPHWVLDHFKQKDNYTKAIRDVLTAHVQEDQIKDTPT